MSTLNIYAKPNISIAIPKRYYKSGVYTMLVPEEIEYNYLLAGTKNRHNEPGIYSSCKTAQPDSIEPDLIAKGTQY